jgi:hypothetical protein
MTVGERNIVIAVGLFVVAFLVFILWPRPTLHLARRFEFSPDRVMGVNWKVGGESYSYTRATPHSGWLPAVESTNLQSRLNLFSIAAFRKTSPPKTQVEVELVFSPDDIWKGIYGNGKFAWTEGEKKGLGFEMEPKYTHLFEEGVYSFATHRWTWCSGHPSILRVHFHDEDFTVFLRNHVWTFKQNGKEAKLDATGIEKWLAQACEVQVEYFRDLKNFPIGMALEEGSIDVEWESGGKIRFPLKKDFFVVNDQMAVTGQKIFDLFLQLKLFVRN